MKTNARFEQGYVGMPPIFLEADDEAELLWPGSFRQVGDNHTDNTHHHHHHQNFVLTGSSDLSFTEVNPQVDLELENSTPDLTLKL